MSTARRDPPDPAGGRVGRASHEEAVDSAAQWGRLQAARAPRWSPGRRRRMAVLLGLALPESTDLDDTRRVAGLAG
jgi:hypothetical protein